MLHSPTKETVSRFIVGPYGPCGENFLFVIVNQVVAIKNFCYGLNIQFVVVNFFTHFESLTVSKIDTELVLGEV